MDWGFPCPYQWQCDDLIFIYLQGMSPATGPHLSLLNAPPWFAFCWSCCMAGIIFSSLFNIIGGVGLVMAVAVGRHYVFL